MNATEEDVGFDIDLDKEPPCEGSAHPAGTHGHDGGPAKWVLRFPCAHSVQVCQGRAIVLASYARIRCYCDQAYGVAEVFFTNL